RRPRWRYRRRRSEVLLPGLHKPGDRLLPRASRTPHRAGGRKHWRLSLAPARARRAIPSLWAGRCPARYGPESAFACAAVIDASAHRDGGQRLPWRDGCLAVFEEVVEVVVGCRDYGAV